MCSEVKVELQKLRESSRNQDQIQAASNQTIADLGNEIENQNVLLSEQTANWLQDQSADQNISNLEEKHVLLSKISKSRKEQFGPLGTKGRTRERNRILEGACE